ncbi:MAG TPA: hypothetical protein VM367_14880, partial [Pseudonocardia sp.]|nr:hypothetical protein [Pseudonocardia sp.]
MVLRIAGLPVFGPSDLVAAARAVVGWTDEAVDVMARLPERLSGLLDDVEVLVVRVGSVVERAEVVLGSVEVAMADVTSLVARVDPVVD